MASKAKLTLAQMQALEFLQTMTTELVLVARQNRLKMPVYFLEMALIEISDQVRDHEVHRVLGLAPETPAHKVSEVA